MVLIKQTYNKIRAKELAKINADCQYCGKKTPQTIFYNRAINVAILFGIPVPYPSDWSILINCDKCNCIVKTEKGNKEANEIKNKYIDVKSDYIKRDFMVQLECCDVCYYENNKKITPSKWEHKLNNTILHLCEKHKEWIVKQNFKTTKELMDRISKWYSN